MKKKLVLLVCLMAMAVTSASAQIYTRLEFRQANSHSSGDANPDYDVYVNATAYVAFYSDAACTIPTTAGEDILLDLTVTNSYSEYNGLIEGSYESSQSSGYIFTTGLSAVNIGSFFVHDYHVIGGEAFDYDRRYEFTSLPAGYIAVPTTYVY